MDKKIKVQDFFVIRSPRLPYFYLNQMNSFKTEEEFWDFAVKVLSESQILESIFIASEGFYSQIKAAMNSPYNQKTRELLPTLYKYIARMAMRPTPFGLFSAISLASVSDTTTKLILSNNFKPQFRLDLSALDFINKTLLKNIPSLGHLCFYPNTTIISKEDYLTYIDFDDKTVSRSFSWSRIKNNPLINLILDYSKGGMSYHNIHKKLTSLGISNDKSHKFVEELIGLKLIISETEPVTTCNFPNHTLLKLESICSNTPLAESILGLTNYIKEVQQKRNPLTHSQEMISFEDFLDAKPQNLIQADLMRELGNGTIDIKFIRTITKELFELKSLFQLWSKSDLEIFIKKFTAKYGEQEIALLDALDEDFGIGYGSKEINTEGCPLLNGLVEENYVDDHKYKDKLVQKFFEKQSLIKDRADILHITEEDVKELHPTRDFDESLPLGFYLLGNLLSTNGVNNDNLRFNLLTAGGVSSLPLLTRFSHLDSDLRENLKTCAEQEEKLAGDAILAELVFYPEGKAGNILTRPSLFKYEIPIIGQAAVDEEHTISLCDLKISVVQGRIVLRSKRLDKVVLPRLSSAHNFHYSMTLYKFLCDLQIQDYPINFSWDWGTMRNKAFLPRVQYKHLVLSRAQWKINSNIFDPIIAQSDRQKITHLVSIYGLPHQVLLAHGDNELLIDLRNDIGAKILLKELKKKDLILFENLYDTFESPVTDSNGNMITNELIFPILGDSLKLKTKHYSSTTEHIIRKFIPGSEWLYLKIYCGEKESDNILLEQIKPLIKSFMTEEFIQKWFFIRYYDPEPHIRLRFKLTKNINDSYSKLTASIQNVLGQLVIDGKISRILFDTYERELERYGPNNIENCESIFEIESIMVLDLLPIVKQYGEHLRWKFGMVSVCKLLTAFGYEGKEKSDFLTVLTEGFYKEFKKFHKLKFTLDQNYRRNYSDINYFFADLIYKDEGIKTILEEYYSKLKLLHEQCLKSSDYLYRPKEILASLAHMLLNRIFYTKQREQEMVIYHFLSKYIISQSKRINQSFPEIPRAL